MPTPTPKSNTLVVRLLALAIGCYFLWEKIVALSIDPRVANEAIISHFAFKLLIWFFGLGAMILIGIVCWKSVELINWVKDMFKGWRIKGNLKGLGQEITLGNDNSPDIGTDSHNQQAG